MSNQFHDVLIVVEGQTAHLGHFSQLCLAQRVFSFNAILPMPRELDFELNSMVEDACDAMFGQWQNVASRRMFREHAEKHGFPFPLASREQVLACIKEFGEHGEKMFALGALFQANQARFGHGHMHAWRKANWGIECDVEELIVDAQDDSIHIAFSLCGAMPKKILSLVSKTHKDLGFLVFDVSERGRNGKKYRIASGKELEKFAVDDREVSEAIIGLRQRCGIDWINRISGRSDGDRFVEITDSGRAFFKGTQYALRYAVNRLAAGEPVGETMARLPGLPAGSADFLASLMTNESLARRI